MQEGVRNPTQFDLGCALNSAFFTSTEGDADVGGLWITPGETRFGEDEVPIPLKSAMGDFEELCLKGRKMSLGH